MYSLDINLLRERAEYQTGQQTDLSSGIPAAPRGKYGKIPLFVGVGMAALALMATGGSWLYLGQQTTQLEAKQKDLDQKLGSLKVQDARLAELNTQFSQISGETQSLASVFNQVQPWSAILQDLRESIPQGIQIETVNQTSIPTTVAVPAAPVAPAAPKGGLIDKISAPPNPDGTPAASPSPAVATAPVPASTTPAAAPAPAATTSTATLPADVPTTKIEITGRGKSFEDVNNFILTLKQSAFFNPEDTHLINADLADGYTALTPLRSRSSNASMTPIEKEAVDRISRLKMPKIVNYKIQTTLKRIPATDLMQELERKGAVGLVSRLKSIKQQQPVKP
ncbi:PilN domain-containing protein [Chamaesiphon sp. OTE_75_metabat_556]|uniref:PilN domain-containing protein n=1 Tax=Chamaesiphon sp. OTE_75_metabat_556 TaxID=2964692 RepID=UPI00286BC864|nr:PilN domain-containing protein [Chamaesiphon sp. OTE_75_metabat_556]